MTRLVRTTTPNGEPIVILAEQDYDRLVELAEDTRDSRLIDQALSDHRAGTGETLTSREMGALLAATTPLEFWRGRRGLIPDDLARAVGISPDDLVQLERGERIGDAALWAALAEKLQVQIEDLVPDRE